MKGRLERHSFFRPRRFLAENAAFDGADDFKAFDVLDGSSPKDEEDDVAECGTTPRGRNFLTGFGAETGPDGRTGRAASLLPLSDRRRFACSKADIIAGNGRFCSSDGRLVSEFRETDAEALAAGA